VIAWKSEVGVRQGVDTVLAFLMNRARIASECARRYRRLEDSGSEWAGELRLAYQEDRRDALHLARTLLACTHDTPRHVAGERRLDNFRRRAA
jgi:hypothetical protein